MRNLSVDDGRLIREGWPREECEINIYGDVVELHRPPQAFFANLLPLHYPTEMSLLKYGLNGFLDRMGGPAMHPRWKRMFQRFVTKWCWEPVNYAGWSALEGRMRNRAPFIVQLRQAPTELPAIEVIIVLYIGDLVYTNSRAISVSAVLHRLGISPYPLGRDMHAVYSLLGCLVKEARQHNWAPLDLHYKLDAFIQEYEYYVVKQQREQAQIVTRTGTNQAFADGQVY